MVASQGLHNALKLPDKVAQICNFLGGEVCDAAALVFVILFAIWGSGMAWFNMLISLGTGSYFVGVFRVTGASLQGSERVVQGPFDFR